ncbi:MAG: penicillin-binding protein activator [Pseudomonadota bacterium]
MGKLNLITVQRVIRTGVLALSAVALAACTSNGVRDGLPRSGTGSAAVERILTPNPQGEVIGAGNVRVALLAPLTIPGAAAEIAKELCNGAAMAMQDFGQNRIQLVIKDTQGQAAASQSVAAQAIQEGSSLIVGPLFAANVGAAAGAARPANVPIIAFSTDTSVAKQGVYLFSYTPQADTERMINYAASIGKRSLTAFLPRNPEGNLREAIVRQSAGQKGMIANIIRYDRSPTGVETVASEGVALVQGSDSIYIPEGGPIPNLILSGLKRNGADLTGKQVLGSGAWESVKTSDPVVDGALYPGRDISAFEGFATRYQSQFGTRPGVQAALAYDAITLAAEMARINGPQNPYPSRAIESPRGFQGVNGAFRIRSNGITERGLAVYKVENGSGRLIEGAISRFSGS